MIKMVNEFKLTVVHFARPNPMQICARAWIYRQTKKTVENQDWATGPRVAGPSGRRAAGPRACFQQNPKYRVIERSTNSSYQALQIKILLPNDKKNICGIVYGQHNNADQFLDYLSSPSSISVVIIILTYLIGGFNIDLLKYENCKYSQTLLQCMQSFSMLPTIDKPTRVYGSSATLIDNIFTNNLTNNISSGNIVTDTTDHLAR